MIWIINILALNLLIVFCVELCLSGLFGVKGIKGLATVALINILTNPAVVLCMLGVSMFSHEWKHLVLIALEVGVVGLEGFLFVQCKPFRVQKPYSISFVLNVSSFFVGEILKLFV